METTVEGFWVNVKVRIPEPPKYVEKLPFRLIVPLK